MRRHVTKRPANEEDEAWEEKAILRKVFWRVFETVWQGSFEQAQCYEEAFEIAYKAALEETLENARYL